MWDNRNQLTEKYCFKNQQIDEAVFSCCCVLLFCSYRRFQYCFVLESFFVSHPFNPHPLQIHSPTLFFLGICFYQFQSNPFYCLFHFTMYVCAKFFVEGWLWRQLMMWRHTMSLVFLTSLFFLKKLCAVKAFVHFLCSWRSFEFVLLTSPCICVRRRMVTSCEVEMHTTNNKKPTKERNKKNNPKTKRKTQSTCRTEQNIHQLLQSFGEKHKCDKFENFNIGRSASFSFFFFTLLEGLLLRRHRRWVDIATLQSAAH